MDDGFYFGESNNEQELEDLLEEDKFSVLVIDMQQKFLDELKHYQLQTLIKSQQILLDVLKDKGAPVAVLEFENQGPTIFPIRNKVLKFPKHKFITKRRSNGFHDTELEEVLKNWGRKNICLMGVYSEHCVQSTANDALLKGFKVYTARDLTDLTKRSEYDRSDLWYKMHCEFYENHNELAETIKNFDKNYKSHY